MSGLVTDHLTQYAASTEARNSLRFPTLRNEPPPPAADCVAYADRLAALETGLLSKRDQVDLLWLQYRAWMNAGQQQQAVECLEKTAAIAATPAKKFAFAMLPQIGHADDDRHEEEFWPTALSGRAAAAVKALRKASAK
jgi:hypothetical protein